jgi:peptidyl-prolyl cis-trans isomerase C
MDMSNPKTSNTPIIIGVVALVIALAAGGFLVSKNMKKDGTSQVETAADASSDAAPVTASGEPPITAAEEEEANKAAESFGVPEVKKGNPVVAKVDGKDITRVDVFRYIKLMPANVQQLPPSAVYPLALDQVINTRLVQNKAESTGLENDPEVQAQMAMAKQQIIRSIYVQREVDKLISESDVKKKYDETVGASPDQDEIKASHILVEDEAKALELIKQLEAGEDFAKLASTNSNDPGNKDKGGDLGWFSKNEMVPDFADAVFKMGKGDISKAPIKTQFGFHVVKVEDKRTKAKPSFEETKQMIMVDLRREKLEKMLEDWKSAANIEKFDINGDPLKEQTDVAPAAGQPTE